MATDLDGTGVPKPGRVRWLLEAAALWAVMTWLGRLPLDRASEVAGRVVRRLGPRHRRHRIAARNLRLAFPHLSDAQVEPILHGMWDNLGRMFGELAHITEFDCYAGDGRVEVVGVEHLDRLRDTGAGAVLFSAHLGWWDLPALAVRQRGVPTTFVWRTINNPYVSRMARAARAAAGTYVDKGRPAARQMVSALRAGGIIGMLLDQKMNDGIPVPFFGHDAMTAAAAAQFAVRDNVPLLPVRCERLKGARFRVTFYPRLAAPRTGDRAADVAATLRMVNETMEEWIRARPDQWLWVHNRWPDEAFHSPPSTAASPAGRLT